MAAPQSGSSIALRVTRSLTHPREEVFAAWTDPVRVSRWFAPSDDFTVVVDRLEPRVDGTFRIEMRHAGGEVHVAQGRYLEVTPPARLKFTWQWENQPAGGETLVTIELSSKGQETELVLTHERFPDERTREKHQQGWIGCLDRLEAALSRDAITKQRPAAGGRKP